ncbi:site-specific integrase [Sutterella sp.]|uniref:tyrosine-type recombinase/integrase n=1 Tax=Sutterella sp. TaxID=1981025 RepID=UPI0026DFEBCA|nr:site-specific integrase [Sutterella sp.]MDO5531448.1 integrase arm-type DNA-binding domain-containing protein [Sutterella sp.]
MAKNQIEAQIEKKPDGFHRVERGLYVRKREGRRMSWVYVYTVAGKRKEVMLGHLDEMGITAARAQLQRARELVAQGVDPAAQRRERRQEMAAPQGKLITMAELTAEALPALEAARRPSEPKVVERWRRVLEIHLLPVIGARPVAKITRDDVLEVLRPLWEKMPPTAKLVRSLCEAVLAYGIATGRMQPPNPASWRGNLDFFLPPISRIHKTKHHEALTVDDLRNMLALTDWRDPPRIWAAIAFCALTGTRIHEAVGAKWSEIDEKRRIWAFYRRKDRKEDPHRVPLSEQAMLLLARLPRTTDYIFPSYRKGVPHIDRRVPVVVIKRRVGKGTMHGCRSTFRDWAAEAGIDWAASEKALMHAAGNAVVQSYLRTDLLEKRRPIMQTWADTIMPLEWLKP